MTVVTVSLQVRVRLGPCVVLNQSPEYVKMLPAYTPPTTIGMYAQTLALRAMRWQRINRYMVHRLD